MIRMKGKDPVHRAAKDRIYFVILGRYGKAHAQKVRGVIKIIARIFERLPDCIFIRHGGNRRHFGNHSDRRHFSLPWIRDIGAVVIKGGHSANDTRHNCHGMRIPAKASEQIHHLFVNHCMIGDAAFEIL